jgi:hypothetical protein
VFAAAIQVMVVRASLPPPRGPPAIVVATFSHHPFIACSSDLARWQQLLDELVITFLRAHLSILTQGVTSTKQALFKRSTASDASRADAGGWRFWNVRVR